MTQTGHARRTTRLQSFDYRTATAYFVTICTYERRCTLDLPQIRSALERSWSRAACRGKRPQAHDFVVMPNHIHGVIYLARRHLGPLRSPGERSASGYPRVEPGSLGAVVRAFKSASTKWVNTIRGTPGAPVWQRNYYEHVVRDDADLDRVRQYILQNPAKWTEDHNNPVNWPPPPPP